MPKPVRKRKTAPSRDVNQWARQLVEQTTGEDQPESRSSDFKEQLSEYMRKMGRKGGRKSGQTRREWLPKEDRVRVASQAAKARWAKAKKKSESD
jgi:hypothetical protein